jgi:tetratricopeptide (TPR) repeat protein
MEEGIPPQDPPEGPLDERPVNADLRELHHRLKETERRWALEGDSEPLWEEEHELLIKLQATGDIGSLMKRARRAKKAIKARGSAADLAQSSLALWVLERYEEAEVVLRAAMGRLPDNRYPWSLLLRHLSWERDPQDAMDFIKGSLDSVPWRAYALVQLGTLCVDAASRCLKAEAPEACEARLAEARGHLERACEEGGCSEEMRRTAQRLLLLVETLEARAGAARSVNAEEPADQGRLTGGKHPLELPMRKVAEASGVKLEGEPDHDLDLDELERIALMERPDDDSERTYTVLEVTPKDGIDRLRRKRGD